MVHIILICTIWRQCYVLRTSVLCVRKFTGLRAISNKKLSTYTVKIHEDSTPKQLQNRISRKAKVCIGEKSYKNPGYCTPFFVKYIKKRVFFIHYILVTIPKKQILWSSKKWSYWPKQKGRFLDDQCTKQVLLTRL